MSVHDGWMLLVVIDVMLSMIANHKLDTCSHTYALTTQITTKSSGHWSSMHTHTFKLITAGYFASAIGCTPSLVFFLSPASDLFLPVLDYLNPAFKGEGFNTKYQINHRKHCSN